MKTLYVNLGDKQIESIDSIDVFNYSLLDDFFYYLGDAIVGEINIDVNKICLIKDFDKPENMVGFQNLMAQWECFKMELFRGDIQNFEVKLPQSYLDWLCYNCNDVYRNIYFKSNINMHIFIDVKSFYCDCIETLTRAVMNFLTKENNYRNYKTIVLGDENISSEFPLVRKISALSDDLVCVTLKAWKQLKVIEEELEQKSGDASSGTHDFNNLWENNNLVNYYKSKYDDIRPLMEYKVYRDGSKVLMHPPRLLGVKINGKWGWINVDEQLVIPAIYDYGYVLCYDGVILLEKEGKYGGLYVESLSIAFQFKYNHLIYLQAGTYIATDSLGMQALIRPGDELLTGYNYHGFLIDEAYKINYVRSGVFGEITGFIDPATGVELS